MSQVLARSTRILDALAQRPLSRLGELAESLRMPPATCARLLASLVDLGWADQISPRGAYRLGPRVHALAASRPYQERLTEACKPWLAALAARLSQPVLLVGLRGERRQVLLMRSPNSREAEFLPTEDSLLYRTPTGRLLLAYLSPRRRRRLLARIGLPGPEDWPGVIDRAELLEELARLRRSGHEFHFSSDWHSCAVWIGRWDGRGACIGTLAPPGRLHPDSLERLREARRELLPLSQDPRED